MAVNERAQPGTAKNAFAAAVSGASPGAGLPNRVYGQPVYSLGLRGLRASMPAVRQVGWLFCTIDANGNVVAGDVPSTPLTNGKYWSSRRQGAGTQKLWDAWQAVQTLAELQDVDYELWGLRVPELRIEAFWLKAPPLDSALGSNDKVYPVLSLAGKLPESTLISMELFLREIRTLAPSQVSEKARI